MLVTKTNSLSALVVLAASAGSFSTVMAEESAPDVPQGWQRSGKIGLFLDFQGSRNASTSRDTNISEGENSGNITFVGEAKFTWTKERNQTEHTLQLRYSTERIDDSWVEDDDLIEYRGVYRRYFSDITFAYGGAGLDSVFTGPEPDEDPLNPTDARISAGIGQIRLWGEWKNSFEYRVGIRAQDTWGSDDAVEEWERDAEVGAEGLLHYIVDPIDKLNFYVRFEAFTPFDDAGNVEFLLTSGLSYKLLEFVTLDLYFRGYYEGLPEEAPEDAPGYDEVSYRNSLLMGVSYSF